MKFKLKYVLIVSLFIGLTACSVEDSAIHGNGQVVEEARQINDFEKLIVNGPFQVTVEEGDSDELIISGESNILPHITNNVINGFLILEQTYQNTLYISKPLIITVPTTMLKEIELNGTGSVSAPSFETEELHLHLRGDGKIQSDVNAEELSVVFSGAGEIEITGAAQNSEMYLEGTGEFHAFDAIIQNLDLDMYGKVNANIHVEKNLDVAIEGSANVIYMGDPEVTTYIIGSGTVKKKE